jgi:threonine 3-dehydrogenase
MVSAETHIVCNTCEFCLNDQKHICENTKVIGVDMDGCFAQYIALPEENLILNDEGLPLTHYSIQEPLGNAVHTLMAQDIKDKSVVIVGVGPIGFLALDAAMAMGAKQVIAIDVVPYRLDLANAIGADAVINATQENVIERVLALCGKHGADVVCEMSGNTKALQQALKYTKAGGHLSLLGIYSQTIDIDISHDVVFKGIHIHGITGRHMFKSWDKVKELINSNKLHLDQIITHVLDWTDIEHGMELMHKGECGKIVLKVKADE